ncbi:hypothetical protein BK131_04320 [Paenibacillus amylolyticus]|uniref:Uncharacterized protein n=1 Tax=Paenibacillus amylolyticus TaxID=1451 RepID=A0A1R1C578_PAEAM|nr:hypothetical protein [Paenibacillus amylolyticus]OMF17197.1 hypothetical protein BK131_04320 [Paenibacillus amylolyticus]
MTFIEEQPIDYTNYLPDGPQARSVAAEMVSTRQSEQVKAALFSAKQFPRDQQAAFNRIMQACQRKKLAEEASYEFPKGGSKVTGPSIRLAEVLAQNWGNMEYGVIELEQVGGVSKMEAYAWDIETNTRRSMIFNVSHERKAKGRINKLDDPRDIYELTANMGSRRVRACILGVIPGDIVDAAVERCQKTLKDGYTEPLTDRIRKALQQFQEKYGVSKEMLEDYIGCGQDAFTENDFLKIAGIWRSLSDNMAKREDYFTFTKVHTPSSTEEEFLKLQAEQSGKEGGSNVSTGQSELPLD